MTNYSGMRVLVTGGMGFIASNLARRLVREGAEVALVDSLIPEFGGMRWIGAGYPENRASKSAEHYYDGGWVPFADDSFDSMVASEVFEHVFNPDQFLSEVVRVLKSEGKVLLTMPFVWDEHE